MFPQERTGKQCRERWFNHLDPTLKHTIWSEEEDMILLAAQAKLGNYWTKIALELPGRRLVLASNIEDFSFRFY
jgi:transcription factor MYB, plant